MVSEFSGSSKILFLSDVHLGAFSDVKNKQLEQQIIQLIGFAELGHYRLVVLGDLFDYWMEYPYHVPCLGKDMLRRFQQFHQQEGASLYITGNHDNWTLGHFADIGFDVEPEGRIIHMNGARILLLHGDAIGDHPGNLQRPLFHRILRNKMFLKIYRGLLSPTNGLELMKRFSKLNRLFGEESTNPKILDKWAQHTLKNNNIDFILCGHDHMPRIHKYDYGTYINLGNFEQHHSLVEYNNGQFSLVQWMSNEMKLHPFQHQTFANE